MKKRLREEPVRSRDAATRDVALTRLAALASAKKMNGIKAWLLVFALLLEVVAVALVACAVSVIL